MDIFSHGLYGGFAFGKKSRKDYITAFFFGIGPDLFSFGPYFVSVILGLEAASFGHFDPSHASGIPQYVHSLYNVTHSFVIYGLFLGLLLLFGKKNFAKLTFGWPLHILVDMPVHSTAFFPTPFLWPVSNFHINGIPWSEPYIFFPNIIFLVVLYALWYRKTRLK